MMKNKKFIGRYCDIINPCAIFLNWAYFFDDNSSPKDNHWKAGYKPKDLKNWKIIEVGENKYYQNGVFLLEKGNHVVIYDAENVRIKNIGILKYRIHSENYIRTYYFDFGDINNIWEANLWNSI